MARLVPVDRDTRFLFPRRKLIRISRRLAGLAFNETVKTNELKAPIVIGRDHLDPGSVASPNRGTEAMADGSGPVSDWPLRNAAVRGDESAKRPGSRCWGADAVGRIHGQDLGE